MSTFPLQKPLDSKALISTTCHLYRISVIKVLPISILFLIFYNFIRFGEVLFQGHPHWHLQASMFALLFTLPLMAMIFYTQDDVAKDLPIHYRQYIVRFTLRFLSLMGSLFSMLLFPLFILGICVGIYLYLGYKQAPFWLLLTWKQISYVFVFATVVTKLFAPLAALMDEKDANNAVDFSEQMVKGFYWRTFLQSFYAILLLVFLAYLPLIVQSSFIQFKIPFYVYETIGQILLILIGPWAFASILTQKYDLQSRLPMKPKAPEQTKPQVMKPKIVSPKDDQNLNF
jgi:hypothetical protein